MNLQLDSGFLFGLGFFETIEVIENRPIFLDAHLNRLNTSCKAFHLPMIKEKEVLDYIHKETTSSSYVLRITVTEKNTLFTTRPHPYLNLNTPWKATISKIRKNPHSLMLYHKSIQYYENIYEKRKKEKLGFDEVLFLNTYGFLAEGSVSNLFWIQNNILYTPSVGSGILSGIMRNWVVGKAKESHISVQKGFFNLSSLQNADAVFATNSLIGIQPIFQIENMVYNNSYHNIILLLRQQYEKIRQQKE